MSLFEPCLYTHPPWDRESAHFEGAVGKEIRDNYIFSGGKEIAAYGDGMFWGGPRIGTTHGDKIGLVYFVSAGHLSWFSHRAGWDSELHSSISRN